ncbi:MAG: glycosyltransferase family 39 protein, partial [Microgenomates group bacterium]
MKAKINSWIKEAKEHPFIYLLLFIILALAFFVRVYRTGPLLGFYYDQGRDALVIWDLWHKGKFFLIGPTTGIAGIFRGPFYYYLIAPFYLLGGGDPVWPAVFLAFTTVVAIAMLYYLGFKIQDRATGLLAAIIGAFSFNIVLASRWLSNPTPMLLLSVLLVWMMILATEGKKWAWPIIAFIAGLSLFH